MKKHLSRIVSAIKISYNFTELEVKVAEIDSQGRINLVRNDIEYDNAEMPRRSAPGQRPPRRDANRR